MQVAVHLFSNRSQRTSKCGKNISDTLGCTSCATFLFLPHFDVICDLLLERCTATWNLFVNYTTNCLLPNFSRSFEHRHPKDYVEKTSKFWDDLSSHKEQNKGNSRIIHSFVGLIYPNLIEEHCKFTVTENVLISISVEP